MKGDKKDEFLSHTFPIEVSLMTNLNYNQVKPNEQKNCFQEIAHLFLDSYLSFRNFKCNFDFFWGFTNFLEFYGITSLVNVQ